MNHYKWIIMILKSVVSSRHVVYTIPGNSDDFLVVQNLEFAVLFRVLLCSAIYGNKMENSLAVVVLEKEMS